MPLQLLPHFQWQLLEREAKDEQEVLKQFKAWVKRFCEEKWFIREREKSSKDEQEVIDVVSQFAVLRSSDRSLTFLHNLIPT